MTDAGSWQAAEDWLWRLFNDPIRDNPWSIVALMLIVACGLLGMIWLTWVVDKIGRMMFGRRAKETDVDDRRQAGEAITMARALHDDTDEPLIEGGAHRPETLADLPPVATYIETPPMVAARRAGTDLPDGPILQPLVDVTLLADEPPDDKATVNPRYAQSPGVPYEEPSLEGTSTRMERAAVAALRPPCTHCRGKGYVMTTNDLLRESIALVGDGGDMVVKEFYTRLLSAAPDLAALFPPDLLTAASGDELSGGYGQRNRLLGALVALSQAYDPTDPAGMDRLDTALNAYGGRHAAFQRPDGTVSGASLEEYAAVKSVLFGTLVDAAGEAWRDDYTRAWSEAYDYAAGVMLAAQRRSGASFPRQARA